MANKNDFLSHEITTEHRDDGTIILGSALPLGPVVESSCEWLENWAEKTPDNVFLGERDGDGWRELTYAEALADVKSLAAGLLANGISYGDRVVILSGPSISHALLMMASQYIGAVGVPLAEQYALIPEARGRLAYCVNKTEPKLVYAEDGAQFADALAMHIFDNLKKFVGKNAGDGQKLLSDVACEPNADLDSVHQKVGPETLAKILFTSGSTSDPKGVPQTQRMMCVNQAQYLATLPILGKKRHVMLDWLPWNHVFAGNSNFNMLLSNGGALYLDDGKPAGPLAARTIENMRTHPSTLCFDVPVAHAVQEKALREDPEIRKKYFETLDIFFYAGASLPADVWKSIEEMSIEVTGEKPMMMSSWGMTETAPAALIYHEMGAETGMIGVPVPELEAKLIPLEDNRYELRVRGPNIFTGYYKDPVRSAESFDDEGFFITGDAVRFADPKNLARGLTFDGRIGEDFKLTTGTWVQASTLRLKALPALAGLVQDVIIVGEGKSQVGIVAFAPSGVTLNGDGQAITDPGHLAKVRDALEGLASGATGSSNKLARAIIATEPPHVGDGEITAKGSLNVRVITRRRKDLLDRLYSEDDPAVVQI